MEQHRAKSRVQRAECKEQAPIGVMERWNGGIKSALINCPTIPKFHDSIIPFSCLLLLASCFLLLTPCSLLAGNTPTASEIVKNVQKNYDETNDAIIHFMQTVTLPVSNLSKTTKGILYLKKGNKYKIESGDNVIVTDGKTTWTYDPSSKQVVIDNYRNDKNTINPDKFLLNIPSDYYVVLLSAKQTNEDTAYTLRLIPKSDNSFIRSIKIVVTGHWTVRSAEVSDMNDNQYTYTVTDLKINPGLPESEFKFVPPRGAQVVDLRQR